MENNTEYPEERRNFTTWQILTSIENESKEEYLYEVNGTSENDYGDIYTQSFSWFISLHYVVVSLGILLNLVFLFTVARVPKLRSSTTNYYLVNLSIVDSILLMISLMYSRVDFSPQRAIIAMMYYTLLSVSALTIMVLSVERFTAIAKPITYRRISSKTRTIKLIIAIWILGIAFTIPSLVYSYKCIVVPAQADYYDCLPDLLVASLCVYLTPIFLSVGVVLILYSVLIAKLYCCAKITNSSQRPNFKFKSQVDHIQVVRMLGITAAIFFICITPFLFIFTIRDLAGFNTHLDIILIADLFLYINSSVNPIIYNVSSARYSRGLVSAFTFTLCARTTQTDGNTGIRGDLPLNETAIQSPIAGGGTESSNIEVQHEIIQTEDSLNTAHVVVEIKDTVVKDNSRNPINENDNYDN